MSNEAMNWRLLLADLQEIALEGGYAIEEHKDVTLARRGGMDRPINLTDVAQELAKRGWSK